MKSVFNSLFLGIFLLCALVQFNDVDAWAWLAVYTAASVMCMLRLLGRLPRWYPITLLAICLAWIAILLPDVVGKASLAEIAESISMQTKAVEQAREIGGLALVSGWSAVLVGRKA